MRNKQPRKYRHSKEHNKSNSQQKGLSHGSHFSSLIFQSGRSTPIQKLDSIYAASPRIQGAKALYHKQTYFEFVNSSKINAENGIYNHHAKRHSNVINNVKNGAITPNPKRTSPTMVFTQRTGRKSAFDRLQDQNSRNGSNNPRIIKIQKVSPYAQDNKFLIKGKIIRNTDHQAKQVTGNVSGQNSRTESRTNEKHETNFQRKIPKSHRKISKKDQSMNKPLDTSSYLDIEQEKLITKLFTGIQFHRDLGRGAHALVRSAVDWNKKRKIAIKVYEKGELTDDQLNSIEREIEVLMSLSHQNIIRLYQIIQSYKTINLIMEYGGGNSLQQYMRNHSQGLLHESQAREIFCQVCKAAAYLHSSNVAHRDLKTENILLNKRLQLKIIDFGFSLICSNSKFIASYCGTPTYMAPEVVSKTPHNPILSDRWSLGVLLFTILNGYCPFKAGTQKELFALIKQGEYEYFTEVSADAKSLITAFLQKDPSKRITPEEALKSKWMTAEDQFPDLSQKEF